MRTLLKKHKEKVIILAVVLLVLDIIVWRAIFSSSAETRFLFLDVGQGDSELVEFPESVQLLIDGGPPNGAALRELGRELLPTDRYIDLVAMTHAQLDHYGGLVEVLHRYRIGAFLWTGRRGEFAAYGELERVIREQGIRTIVLGAGDRIRHHESVVEVLAPTPALLRAKDLNDTSLVLKVTNAGVSALFTGDIGELSEASLIARGIGHTDILKVPHHGSRFSSTASFLGAVRPALAVVEVGKNSYGHPTRDALSRLAAVGAFVFRTDERGTIEVRSGGSGLRVSSSR